MIKSAAYFKDQRKINAFLAWCAKSLAGGETFAFAGATKIRLPHNFSYDEYFKTLRNEVVRPNLLNIKMFGTDINDGRFTSTEKLIDGKTYKIEFYLLTKWSDLKTIKGLCQSREGAILAGPHGLALAIQHANSTLPVCKLLISLDPKDKNSCKILSAGKGMDQFWSFSVHCGDFAPGTFFAVFFEDK